MLAQIAVLIPTFGRFERLDEIVKNFKENSSVSKLYFIIEKTDKHTVNWFLKSKECGFIISGEYVEAINYGFDHTVEPFIFCGADDIEFSKNWDTKLLKNFENKNIHITGGTDDWLCSQGKIHISHPLIRRSYVNDIGSCYGHKGMLYFTGYTHYFCDIELEQIAWTRGCIKVDDSVTIAHNHFVNKKVSTDSTYKKSCKFLNKDQDLYNKRKKLFEYWDLTGLHSGMRVESEHRMKKVSIVMPIWNCKEYVEKTVDSLIRNTQHKYEIIVIDDNSNELDSEFLAILEDTLKNNFLNVKFIRNEKQMFCNYNWNQGVKLATGDYIAIINADIEFKTQDWDDFLSENIDFGYQLVNPYQDDRIYKKPYMKPPHEDFLFRLNIRGACFMISKEFAKSVFPIPKQLVHWFGDNYISQKAKDFMYDIRVVIYHHISKSGERVNQKEFWKMVGKDAVEYTKIHPTDDISPVANTILSNQQFHSK